MTQIMDELIKFDQPRCNMFRTALRYVDYECVAGDVVEAGVYTGRSLALLADAAFNQGYTNTHCRMCDRVVWGFDNFSGLPEGSGHPRWHHKQFAINHSWHPILHKGDAVTPECVYQLFEMCQLPKPKLCIGDYKTLDCELPNMIAVLHIDCDLYESAFDILSLLGGRLQCGSIILFDDWFNYCARPNCGEQRAFSEWVRTINLVPVIWKSYATFGNAVIMTSL